MQIAPPYPASAMVVDPALIRKHDVSGPRYTSYPTADRFAPSFGENELRKFLQKRSGAQAWSLYMHLPFCDTLCYYCACNKVITRDHSKSARYVDYLEREMALLDPLLGETRRVCQLHWGGGTPTFLARDEMERLVRAADARFERTEDFECSIEIDPRRIAPGTLGFLAGLGFNRVSIGVQDFDPEVQRAVHRIQSEEVTRAAIDDARASGFRSVNLDLIYGLPKQTLEGFGRTLEKVIALAPDRIALYGYAHLPAMFKPQRRIAEAELPRAETKLQIMTTAIGTLTRADYVYIGFDHFARPDDALAIAQSQGRLQRNFQGYSTHADCDMLGLGISSIGRVGPTYYQNAKTLPDYYAALDAGRLPVVRGMELGADDLLRRAVIQRLACDFRLSLKNFESAYNIDFARYFKAEMADLARLAEEGLVERVDDGVVVTPKGRVLVRAVCMVFDRYLREKRSGATYSKVL
ncbi:MAG: oxygen-independent coproporphyrinogen III oxidase [Betaproteobacteria bacterium RIFCSPLOWO2_12_FULL_65_14]|nr:MAG: oxygen-independent coproporphyrinogen III oxidase [Betaproteobacteria bacterium RIFCSPLOWO2_12_FULL_65_14]